MLIKLKIRNNGYSYTPRTNCRIKHFAKCQSRKSNGDLLSFHYLTEDVLRSLLAKCLPSSSGVISAIERRLLRGMTPPSILQALINKDETLKTAEKLLKFLLNDIALSRLGEMRKINSIDLQKH